MTNFRNIYSSDLSHRARSVYMYLKDRADKDDKCWPAIKTTVAVLLQQPVNFLSLTP